MERLADAGASSTVRVAPLASTTVTGPVSFERTATAPSSLTTTSAPSLSTTWSSGTCWPSPSAVRATTATDWAGTVVLRVMPFAVSTYFPIGVMLPFHGSSVTGTPLPVSVHSSVTASSPSL